MSTPIKDQKLLWHITDINNLGHIFKYGLLSRAYLNRFPLLKSDIADQEIINKRRELNLLNYIPFHFFVNNPFDGTILRNYPSNHFCYISIRREFAKHNNFLILTKHPLASDAKLLNYSEGFSKIDWNLLEKRDYQNQECKLTCMAEVLALNKIACSDFFSIVVSSNEDYTVVSNLANKMLNIDKKIYIDIEPSYFSARGIK